MKCHHRGIGVRSVVRWTGLAAAGLALGACAGRQDPGAASVDIRGSDPAAATTAAPAPSADGIVRYDSYEAAVAREGETVGQVAARVGLSGAELGAYNGLQPDQPLRAGDELVLPPRPGGYDGTSVAAAAPPVTGTAPVTAPAEVPRPVPETAAVASASDIPSPGTAAAATPAPAATGATVWSPAVAAAAIERAEVPAATGAAETAAADPEAAGSPETALATVTPVPQAAPTPTPGSAELLTPPPSSGAPLPPDPQVSTDLSSPDLGQYQTPEPGLAEGTDRTESAVEAAQEAEAAAASALADEQVAAAPATAARPDLGIAFTRPVSGEIAVPYNVSSSGQRNEGVDFAAAPGTPVRASAAGEVALVSQSLGGLGTIVLVRHRDDVLTVYGRVTDVPLQKGQRVEAGQQIGVVAPGDGSGPPRMHFEIRKGAESIDPMLLL